MVGIMRDNVNKVMERDQKLSDLDARLVNFTCRDAYNFKNNSYIYIYNLSFLFVNGIFQT